MALAALHCINLLEELAGRIVLNQYGLSSLTLPFSFSPERFESRDLERLFRSIFKQSYLQPSAHKRIDFHCLLFRTFEMALFDDLEFKWGLRLYDYHCDAEKFSVKINGLGS